MVKVAFVHFRSFYFHLEDEVPIICKDFDIFRSLEFVSYFLVLSQSVASPKDCNNELVWTLILGYDFTK